MPIVSVADLVAIVGEHRLLLADQWQQLQSELPGRHAEAHALARALVQRGWLTPFQVNELFVGRGAGLLLGSHVLLEKLGEGGMGTVYKARNWKLDRIVALKVIRKERLANPSVVKRFYREIRSAAHLNHPHIVRAFDADEVEGTHFLVMEFVDGIDLARHVKLQGPLPVETACDYLRQAALGLQHAFERGLVHRDIKPHNLLLCWSRDREGGGRNLPLPHGRCSDGDVIKILDMGLALAEAPYDEEKSSTMTQEGTVMGTPDYVAPEQIMDSHRVDIRADLYSLGCTLYFLLSGQPPFRGGSLGEKLVKHQMHEPEPIEKHRPDAPPAVRAILRKLLAKRPEERHQTPAELAQALGEALAEAAPSAPEISRTEIADSPVPASGPDLLSLDVTMPAVQEFRQRQARAGTNSWRRWLLMGAAFWGFVLLAAGLYFVTRGDRQRPEPVDLFANKPPRPVVPAVKEKEKAKEKAPHAALLAPGPVTEEWIAAVQALSAEEQGRAVIAKLKELNEGFNDLHGHCEPRVHEGKIVALTMRHQRVTDISPVRALKDLEELSIGLGSTPSEVISLADLSPLRALPLKRLALDGNRVEDLSPLTDMKLTNLNLGGTRVKDLSPLKSMTSLVALSLDHTPVTDLAPLQNLKLESLGLRGTGVKDLKPLAAMPLQSLDLWGADVSDLAALPVGQRLTVTLAMNPIEDLTPLARAKKGLVVVLHGVPYRSLEPLEDVPNLALSLAYDPKLAPTLKRCKGLEKINGMKPADFWKLVDPDPEHDKWVAAVAALRADEQIAEALQRMKELNPGIKAKADFVQKDGVVVEARVTGSDAKLVDLRFLQPLKHLQLFDVDYAPNLRNLEPLRGMPLHSLMLNLHALDDLSPLARMPLRELVLSLHGGVGDLVPLKAVKTLRRLDLFHLTARLAPVLELPLTRLSFAYSNPRDFHLLQGMKSLEDLRIPYDDFRHRDTLRAMTWLKTINDKKPEDFWKDIAEQQAAFVSRELKRLNPGLAKATPRFENGAVVGLKVELAWGTAARTLLDPVRTLTELAHFDVSLAHGAAGERSLSLEPLRGLPLTRLEVSNFVPETLAPLQGRALENVELSHSAFNDLSSLKGLSIRTLRITACPSLTDLAPLRDLTFEDLWMHSCGVKDLSPLKGLKLKTLKVSESLVEDLSPLRELPLTRLIVSGAHLKDLTPLGDMKSLRELVIGGPRVRDLGPLSGLAVDALDLHGANPSDLAPLRKVPLKRINLVFEPFRGDADVLRAIPALETINGKNAEGYLKHVDQQQDGFYKYCADVAKLPADKQAQAVADELRKRNPGFDGKFDSKVDAKTGAVVEFTIITDGVSDIAPLRALPELRKLQCFGTSGDKGQVANLWPLSGMKLKELLINNNPVTDLAPLRKSPLESLTITGTRINDLSPLQGLPLKHLACPLTSVADLSPLAGMKLVSLHLDYVPVADFSPLRGMPLDELDVTSTAFDDATVLEGMPLTRLHLTATRVRDVRALAKLPRLSWLRLDPVPWRDSALLRSIKTLEMVNDKPAKESHAWADWEDAVRAAPAEKQIDMVKAKLVQLNPRFADKVTFTTDNDSAVSSLSLSTDEVTDISPVRAFPALRQLTLVPNLGKPGKLVDLWPLRALPLKHLELQANPVADLAPLQDMPLQLLNCSGTQVADLSPVKGMKLHQLYCQHTFVHDLAPLRGMPLELLWLEGSRVTDFSPLKDLPRLSDLNLTFVPERDAPILRQIKTLETINGKKKEEILK